RCNVPRSLVTICRATLEAMEKQGLPKIKWASVTILQWSKRFDATLGLCVHLWRCPKLQRRSIEFANLLGCVFRFHDFCGSRGSLVRARMPIRMISEIRNSPLRADSRVPYRKTHGA